jgi:hypothetical protein
LLETSLTTGYETVIDKLAAVAPASDTVNV